MTMRKPAGDWEKLIETVIEIKNLGYFRWPAVLSTAGHFLYIRRLTYLAGRRRNL
jgi:hypothetical protein